MAALDGRITFGIDYRPCLVTIPGKMKLNKNREPEVETNEKHLVALFHCWNHKSELVGESPLRGGHPAGQVSGTYAIVEYQDGTVHEVEPWRIQFVDNVMSEYAFTEIEN